MRSPFHEERLFAVLMLVDIYTRGERATQQAVYEHYLQNTAWINNWDLVDSSAPQIVGAYLYDKDRAPLYALARSASLWERRIAMMATFHLIKQGDFQDALRLAALLLGDKEDLIHKAVGWMLREIGSRAPDQERRFLKQHYLKMPRTMLRYAIEKFPEPERKAYLHGAV